VVAPHEFQNPALTAHLRALPHKDGQLLLFQGDVTQPGSCDAALQAGATRLLHLAAMVKIATNKKEQDMMMHVAMEGTRNVLGACRHTIQSLCWLNSLHQLLHPKLLGMLLLLQLECLAS
jgi:nucleoside-diphosphate-sugar epimerase